MESSKDFFDTWRKSQEKTIENLVEMTAKMQQAFWSSAPSEGGTPDVGDFYNRSSAWITELLKAMGGTDNAQMKIIRDTLSQTFNSSNAYFKLYDIWLPLWKAIQDKTSDPDSFKNFADPGKYKEMLDKVFDFQPDTISEIFSQTPKSFEAFGGTAQEFMKPWADAAEKNFTNFPQFMAGHPEVVMGTFHNMFNAFDSTIGRIFHAPTVGKDREKIELLLRSFDDLSIYLAKSTEFQHTIYVTGQTAIEKVLAAIADKISAGEEINGFNEFFDLWIKVHEKTFYQLFQTEDFSKLQGELLDASLNVRKHIFALMELYLSDFPIVLRSEMDDLYRTVYELNKKVKKMEKQLMEVRG